VPVVEEERQESRAAAGLVEMANRVGTGSIGSANKDETVVESVSSISSGSPSSPSPAPKVGQYIKACM